MLDFVVEQADRAGVPREPPGRRPRRPGPGRVARHPRTGRGAGPPLRPGVRRRPPAPGRPARPHRPARHVPLARPRGTAPSDHKRAQVRKVFTRLADRSRQAGVHARPHPELPGPACRGEPGPGHDGRPSPSTSGPATAGGTWTSGCPSTPGRVAAGLGAHPGQRRAAPPGLRPGHAAAVLLLLHLRARGPPCCWPASTTPSCSAEYVEVEQTDRPHLPPGAAAGRDPGGAWPRARSPAPSPTGSCDPQPHHSNGGRMPTQTDPAPSPQRPAPPPRRGSAEPLQRLRPAGRRARRLVHDWLTCASNGPFGAIHQVRPARLARLERPDRPAEHVLSPPCRLP